MKQEEKQLLLQDLCARLPYYPKCKMIDGLRVVNNEPNPSYIECLFPRHLEIFYFHNNFVIKPYLRPLSSMTEEERKEYELLANHCIATSTGFIHLEAAPLIDWLNAHHFDYRGLIPKGLALEALEGMYKIN